MYAKSDAITQQPGNCQHCARGVTQILVGDRTHGGHQGRRWVVVDWLQASQCRIDHKCPSKPDPAPVRKAA